MTICGGILLLAELAVSFAVTVLWEVWDGAALIVITDAITAVSSFLCAVRIYASRTPAVTVVV
jgi:hypothetical protein